MRELFIIIYYNTIYIFTKFMSPLSIVYNRAGSFNPAMYESSTGGKTIRNRKINRNKKLSIYNRRSRKINHSKRRRFRKVVIKSSSNV